MNPTRSDAVASDPNLESVATFDRHASSYAAKYFELPQYRRHYDWLLDTLRAAHPRVLDLASGPGNVAAHVRQALPDADILCVDGSPRMLDEASSRVPEIRTLCMDCRDIGLLNERFDAAAFFFGLSYLDDAGADRCLAGLRRVIQPGGSLLLATLTGDPAQSGVQLSSQGDRVHMVYRRAEDVRALVERHGFACHRFETIESPTQASQRTLDVVLLAEAPVID